jgi:AcrR family transcriptional regulator
MPARRPPDERRAQLLELGLGQFGKKTYDEVSIDDIADAAGISKGLLYHYFPTKRAFYAATVREACRRLFDATDVTDLAPGLEQLSRSLDAYLDFVDEHGPAYLGLMTSGVGIDPEIGGIVEEARAEFLERTMRGLTTALGAPLKPFADIALHGWIGLVEASTLAWLKRKDNAKYRIELRDFMIASLLAVLGMNSVR